MKKISFFLCAVFMTMIGFAQGSETFENAELPGSYSDGTFVGESGLTFTYGHSRDEENYPIDGNGLMLRRAADSYLEWTVPDGVGELTFEYRKAYTGGNERQLEVMINDDPINTTPIFGNFSGADDTVYSLTTSFNVEEAVTIKIKNVGTTSVNRQSVIDNISWTAFGDTDFCAPPTNVEAGQVTFNQAEDQAFVPVSWTAGGNETSWEVGYVNINDPNDTMAVVVSGTPETTLELQVNTGYDIDVRATCDDGTISDWTGMNTVFTNIPGDVCGFENFDNAADLPGNNYNDGSFVGNDGVTWTYVESRDENGDANNSGIDGNAIMLRQVSDDSKISSSAVAGGISDFEVKLYKGFTGVGNRQVELFVNGVSQGTSDPFDDFDEHVFTVNGIDIAGDVEIEIRNITSKQVIVDDISWTCFSEDGGEPDCPVPTDLAVDNITENSAELSWVGGGTSNQWHVMYGPIGFDPDNNEGTGETTAGSPTLTINGLDDNTEYEFYVNGGCATEWSAYAGPVSFTTLALPPSNNDCENAIALSCGDSVAGTTIGASESGMPSPSCAGGTPADVFYTLDVEEGNEYTITVNGENYDGVLAIYSGACGSLTELNCADDGFSAGAEETIIFTADATETVTIRTYDWSSSAGDFVINVECVEVVYDCPNLGANIGDSCDDGDPNTENDVITEDCECVGTPILVGDVCGFENFDNATDLPGNNYNDGSFVGNDGVTWTYVESRDENGDANNSGIDGNAIMLRRASDDSKISSSAVAGGISDFEVKLYKGFTGVGNRQVELFVNGVSQGTSDPFDDFDEHVFTVNGIDIAGDVEIEIRNITGKQVIIDDIMWTCFDDCPLTDATGGIYLYSDNDTVCTEDAEIVEIGPDSDMGEQNAWIISDENGDIVALPQGGGEFYTVEIDFTGYEEGVYDVTFVTWYGEIQGLEEGGNLNDINGDCYFMPDSISITVEQCVEPCEAPEVVEVSNITDTSADITWSGGSQQGYWGIEYGEAPFQPVGGQEFEDFEYYGSDLEETLTGLNPGTEYIVYVRAMCQENPENVSEWASVSFTTTGNPPCDFPDYNLTVVNADGTAIDCVDQGGSYYVEIEFTGGSDDHTFTLYDNDGTVIAENASSGDVVTAGPYDAGEGMGFYGTGENCDGGFETESVNPEVCLPEPCPAPTDVTIVEVTATTVTVSWSPGGDENSWAPAYGYAGWDATGEEQPIDYEEGVTDTEYTFENLEPNTEYDFYIYSECGAEDWSDIVGPVPFNTVEEQEDCSEPTGISFGQIDFTSAQVSWTPGAAGQDKWEVVYGPAPFNPTTDTGESVIVENDPEVTLTDLTPGTTYQIYVRALCDEDDTPGDYYPNPDDPNPDDGGFDTPEDCSEPTGISFGQIDFTSAQVSWTPGAAGQDKWEVVYGPAPFNPTTDTGESVIVENDPEVTLTDLTPGTTYQIYVRALCDEDDNPGDYYPNPDDPNPDDGGFDTPEDCEDPYNDDAATSDVYISSIDISGIGADLGDPTYDLTYTSNSMSATGYEVITNPILTVYPGLDGTYTVSSGPATNNTNQYYYSVWFDFNQDGCFDEEEQIIWSDNDLWGGGIPNGEPGVEDVPIAWELTGVAPGTYQARIRNSMIGYPAPEGNGDGEALDFTVEVLTEAEAGYVLGVEDQVFTDFTYYPNPVENQLNLRAGTPIEQVEVYNLLGQKVIQEQPNALESNLTTDRLQSGVYLMNVTIDGSQKTFRIVKK